MVRSGYLCTVFIVIVSRLVPSGASGDNKMCYQVSNQRICYFQKQLKETTSNWEIAWRKCQQNNATLPVIETGEVQMTLQHYLKNKSIHEKETWLSGQKETKQEWQWTDKTPFFQPNSILRGEDQFIYNTQGVITRTYTMSSSNLTINYQAVWPSEDNHYRYICQYQRYNSDQSCPLQDSIPYSHHHNCLKVFNDQSENLAGAKKNCEEDGGSLATFQGDEFLQKISQLQQQMQIGKRYLIGLQRVEIASWLWRKSNKENSSMDGKYSNWNNESNIKDDKCLYATSFYHRWEATNCRYSNSHKLIICQTVEETKAMKSSDSTEEYPDMNEYTKFYLIGAIAVAMILIIITSVVVISHLRRNRRTSKKVEAVQLSTSYAKPTERSEVAPVYEEIQLQTNEYTQESIKQLDADATAYEEFQETVQHSDGAVYAEITESFDNRNSYTPDNTKERSSKGGMVYAEIEF